MMLLRIEAFCRAVLPPSFRPDPKFASPLVPYLRLNLCVSSSKIMLMQKYQLATKLLLLFLGVPSISAASSLDGDWIGGFERPESRVFVHAHFSATNNETAGTIDVVDLSANTRRMDKPPGVWISKLGYAPNTFFLGKPLDKLELTPSHLHFELADIDSPLSFEGQVTDGVMTGVVQDRGMKLPFHLDLMARIDPSRYVGNYQVGPGHFIRIVPAPYVPLLLYFDTRSGQIRVLLPRSGTDFVSGPEYDTFHPVDVAIHFITDQLDQVTALQWTPKNAPASVGTRISALGGGSFIYERRFNLGRHIGVASHQRSASRRGDYERVGSVGPQ